MNTALLPMLACPGCRGELTLTEKGLACPACRIIFPIVDNIPVMLLEEALPFSDEAPGAPAAKG